MARWNDDLAIADLKTVDCEDPEWQGYISSYDQEVRAQWTDLAGTLRQSPVIHKEKWTFNGKGGGRWDDNFENLPIQ